MKLFAPICLGIIFLVGCAKEATDTPGATPAPGKMATKPNPGEGGTPISKAGEKPNYITVQEIFTRQCIKCHGANPPKIAAGLNLTSYDEMIKNPAIKAGDANSKLIMAISGPTPSMPKGGTPLSPADVELIKAWIVAGAKKE